MSTSGWTGVSEILRAQGRVWPWVVTVLALTAFLLWAGSAADPRSLAMWAFTDSGRRAASGANTGWLLPAPGIPYFLFAAFFLCGALGRLAFAGMACGGMSRRGKILSAAGVFLGGLGARLVALAWWHAWSVSPESLAAVKLPTSEITWRWLGLVADMVTILLLLSAQLRKRPEEGCNLWVAGVYAFHPIALLAVVNGSRWLLFLPVIVLVALFGPQLRRWVRIALIAGAAGAGCILLARIPIAELRRPFNGLFPLLLNEFNLDGPQMKMMLLVVGMSLEAVVVALALVRRWPPALAWVHVMVIAAMVSPKVMPLALLPLVELLPVAWSYAGGLLTAVSLASFGIMLSWGKGSPFAIPDWLIYITMLPVVVLELEALGREAGAALRLKAGGLGKAEAAVAGQ